MRRAEVHEDDAPGYLAGASVRPRAAAGGALLLRRTLAGCGLQHHVRRLDVAVDETCCVHRRERVADVAPDPRGGARRDRTGAREQIFQRLSAHQLRPQSRAAVVLRRAVDREYVWVPDAREAPRLVDPVARCRVARSRQRMAAARRGLEAPELERHLAFERWIPRAPQLAKASLAYLGQHVKEAPRERRLGGEWKSCRYIRRRRHTCRVLLLRARRPMRGGDALHRAQRLECGSEIRVQRALALPVERHRIRDRAGALLETTRERSAALVVRAPAIGLVAIAWLTHDPSAPRGGPARGRRACARRWRTASPWRGRSLGSSCRTRDAA